MLRLVFLLLAVALTGCYAGPGQGLDGQGLPVDDVDPAPDLDPAPDPNNGVTLAQLQAQIFMPRCATCHAGGNAPQGLRLDSEQNSFDFLVDEDARERPYLKRVNPGNPDQSYIVLKVEGDPTILGGQMPLGGAPLDAGQAGQLRDWIANGAPRTGTGLAAAKISAAGVDSAAPDQVNSNLRFSSGIRLDIPADPWGPVYARGDVEPATAGSRQLAVWVPLADLDTRVLKLVVNEPSLGAVLDSNGLLVDGDGNPGGFFEREYTLEF